MNNAQSAENITAKKSPASCEGGHEPLSSCGEQAGGFKWGQKWYLLEIRVSHHALQVVKDGVPLHRSQGLPGHVAGVLILTLHFGGCRRREVTLGREQTREGSLKKCTSYSKEISGVCSEEAALYTLFLGISLKCFI